MLASRLVGSMLTRKFREYSNSPIRMSGAEIAQRMLHDQGVHEVEIIHVSGQLTDHYNPAKKTVNLSEAVYQHRNIAAAAVAAHECGHAVQHARSYPALQMRSALVPLVSVSNRFMPWVLMGGLVLASSGNNLLLIAAIVLFGVSTLFSVVTLPVEFDASHRALQWLEGAGIADRRYHDQARDALKWAAMTYVVAAVASIGQLLYLIFRLLGSRR